MRTLATVLFVAMSVSPSRAAQEPDHLHIDEVSETFLKQWATAEESRNSKDLLDLYAVAHDTLSRKLARPEPEVERWIPLGRVLAAKLATLPPAALESHEIIARQVFDAVLEPADRRRAIEKYAYTRAGRDALDQMSNIECDRGRMTEALKGWSRALEVRPGVETVARLGFAHSIRKDGVSLAALRAQAETRSIKGQITVEGRQRELYEYLDSLDPARKEPAALLKPLPGPTCEIPLGHYDLREDGRYGERLAVSLPAMGRAGGKDLIVLCNGLRIIAIDAARTEGGIVNDAVEWRWPTKGPVRTWTLGNYNEALPYVGVTVADGRVFCPMFAERQEAHQQVGRRQQKFLGASVLRAVSLQTGEVLWDTETIKVPVNGTMVPLLEHLRLDNSDFCFGGPPLVRGDRLYAAIMTSPFTGRQCWALCLDAATGQPIWCTDLGTAPQTKEMSVAQIAEEDGTLVFSTNYGVVAALDSRTGAFEWLVKYMNSNNRSKRSHRTAGSPPVIAGSLVYVLTQDCDELLAFDRWTGLEAPLPKHSVDLTDVWKDIVHLIGASGDWLAFSGSRNLAIRPLDGQVVSLPESEKSRFGRGAISGGRLYLPTRNELSIFDTSTWKLVESLKWSETSNPGNLLVAGPFLVHLSDRLDVYTSPNLLLERFGTKVGGQTPIPQDCRQLARILESSGRLKESVRYYRRALQAWENDPAWQETADGLKKKLTDLAAKLGDDFPKDQ